MVRPLACEHLVVGAGLLGLATADHLLRRGASGVVVAERASAPNGGRPGEVGPLLRHGAPPLEEAESRTRLLLASGPEYLDHDFLAEGSGYRRLGSLRLPAEDAPPFDTEVLAAEARDARFPELALGDDRTRFFPDDGTLDTMALIAALHARVRAQGGRVLFDAEVGSLSEEEDAVTFAAGGRRGRASRVSLAAGARTLPFLPALGVRHPWPLEAVHVFRITTDERPETVLWIPERRAVIVPVERREWAIEIAVDHPAGSDPTVDWTLLQDLRGSEGRLPWVGESEVRRARVLPRLGFDPGEPILVSRGGRIAAAGAFGPHGLGLFAAVGEQLAERALSPLDPLGGILEDPL